MLRSVVAIMGTVALAFGFAQILSPGTWPALARALVAGEYVTSCGLVAIVAGLARVTPHKAGLVEAEA